MINEKKVVVLMEKFCDLNPTLGETSAYSNVVGSLKSTGIKDPLVLHYDEYLISRNSPIDEYLLDVFSKEKPDLLAVSYYPYNDPRNVKLETFQKMKEMGIPIVFIWFDYGHHQIKTLANSVGAGFLNVVVDIYDGFPMWVPQDESIFNYQSNKNIDVSFVGTTSGYGTRAHYLGYLNQHHPIHVSGGQREHKLTIEQYAEILKMSKISINFPDKPDGTIQAKCRIYESMLCGALLLEKENDAIKRWFEPMVHYIPFYNEVDLVNKIRYYLTQEEERQTIVNNALEKMKEYSSFNWWTKVYNQARNL